MAARKYFNKVKSGFSKQVAVRNGKTSISELDDSDPIISLAVKTLSEDNSKKLTYLAGRGRYTYGTLDLSDTGSSQEIEELEGRVSSLENEYGTLSEMIESVYESLQWIDI